MTGELVSVVRVIIGPSNDAPFHVDAPSGNSPLRMRWKRSRLSAGLRSRYGLGTPFL